MTAEAWPFGPVDTTAAQYAEMFNAFSQPGQITGLGVTAVPGHRKVSVAAGTAVINGFHFSNDAGIQLNISPNTSGDTRLDAIVAQMNVLTESFTLEVYDGYSATELPYIPTDTSGLTGILLAVVAVPDGATTITSGMITSIPQHIADGYSIVSSDEALSGVSSEVALNMNSGLLHVNPSGTWSTWQQDTDAADIISGRFTADRLPFSSDQVNIPDGADGQSPTFIKDSDTWGWGSRFVANSTYNLYSGSGNGTKFGTTIALVWQSASFASSEALYSTDPVIKKKWEAGMSVQADLQVVAFMPSPKLVNGIWEGSQVSFTVDISDPYTGRSLGQKQFLSPYFVTAASKSIPYVMNVPIVFSNHGAFQIKVSAYRFNSKAGTDGFVYQASVDITKAYQLPYLES